ncbi:hypothetical protein KF840_20510 [bacterium]|nr:hypothetical protein [bacterium]
MADRLDVLIIDRNDDDAFLAMRMLRRAGLDPHPVRVETPRQLGEALARSAWDLVLCDGLSPMLSLPDVVAAVHDALPRTPVVVLSSRWREVDEIGDRMGIAGVIAKEALDRLPSLVRRVLAGDVPRRATPLPRRPAAA